MVQGKTRGWTLAALLLVAGCGDDTDANDGAAPLGDAQVGGDAGSERDEGDAGDSDDVDAGGDDNTVGDAAVTIDAQAPDDALTIVREPSGVALRLDRVVYDADEHVEATLDFGDIDVGFDVVTIALASTESGDAEAMQLERVDGNRFESTAPLSLTDEEANSSDGKLSVAPGQLFHALYFVDHGDDDLDHLKTDMITDFGLISPEQGPSLDVDADAALSDDESNPPSGAKPVGTLVKNGGLPIQIATEELIVFPRDEAQLTEFLQLSGGEVLAEQELDRVDGDEVTTAYLVAIDPDTADLDNLPALQQLFDETSDIIASKSDALGIMELSLRYQAEGFVVAVNPRLQYQGAPLPVAGESVSHTMAMTPALSAESPCVPGVEGRECVENVPALWAYTALWDGDDREVKVAVLDMGFAPNADFRRPGDGSDSVQCDMAGSGIRCEPGAAEGAPTVGNSFFGDRSWHGTGVVTTMGGIVNDGSGASGVAGLNAVPMLYKFDTASYAFEMGAGILRAVADGASVVNLSAGYPCNVITSFGPDLDICSSEGRLAICTVVTAAVHAAAALTCATVGPLTLGFACGAAVSAATAETAACTAAVALGNLKGPMASAVTRAAFAGVPVVTIAGNRLSSASLPPVIRDYVDISDPRTERWGIIPAVLPESIVVGAIDEDLENVHFHGDRVDIWAPIRSNYFHPSSVDDPDSAQVQGDIGGTSAAAPFITGVVATMQSINSELDPANPVLSRAERAGIVGRVKGFLSAGSGSFNNTELRALGYADDSERRLVIDPLGAVRSASAEALPDLSGYDSSVNFSELLLADDSESDARELLLGETLTGTIVHLPATDEVPEAPDQDWYTFTIPDTGAAGLVRGHARLEFPAGFGNLSLTIVDSLRASGTTVSPESAVSERSFIGAPGERVTMRVAGIAGADNVYKLTVTELEPEAVRVRVLQPIAEATVCANRPIDLVAMADVAPFARTIPSGAVEWFEDEVSLGVGSTVSSSFDSGTHTVSARAYGSTDSAGSVTFTAEVCPGEPPDTTIVTPSSSPVPSSFYDANVDGYDGYDDELEMWYVDLDVEGSSVDPEDGTLTGDSLIWRTDQTDIQDEELGTGTNPTIRIYSDDCFGTTHIIRLEGTDSDGNITSDVFEIFIATLC